MDPLAVFNVMFQEFAGGPGSFDEGITKTVWTSVLRGTATPTGDSFILVWTELVGEDRVEVYSKREAAYESSRAILQIICTKQKITLAFPVLGPDKGFNLLDPNAQGILAFVSRFHELALD